MDYSFLLTNIDLVPSISLPDVCSILSHAVTVSSKDESKLKGEACVPSDDDTSSASTEVWSLRVPTNFEESQERGSPESLYDGFGDVMQYPLNQCTLESCNEDSMVLSDVDSDATIDLIDSGNEAEAEADNTKEKESGCIDDNCNDGNYNNDNDNNDNDVEKQEAFNTQDLCDDFNQHVRIGIDDDAIEDFSDEEEAKPVTQQKHCRLPLVLKNDKSVMNGMDRIIAKIDDLEGADDDNCDEEEMDTKCVPRDHKNLSLYLSQQDEAFALCCYSSLSKARVYQSIVRHFMSLLSKDSNAKEEASIQASQGSQAQTSPWMTRCGQRETRQGQLLIVTTKSNLTYWYSILSPLQPQVRVLNYTEPLSIRRRQGMSNMISLRFHDIVVTTFDILKSKEVTIDPGIIINNNNSNNTAHGNVNGAKDKVERSYLHIYEWNHILLDYHDTRTIRRTNQAGTAVYNLHTSSSGTNDGNGNSSSTVMSVLQVDKAVLKVDIITDSLLSQICENMKLPREIPPSSLLFDARRIV